MMQRINLQISAHEQAIVGEKTSGKSRRMRKNQRLLEGRGRATLLRGSAAGCKHCFTAQQIDRGETIATEQPPRQQSSDPTNLPTLTPLHRQCYVNIQSLPHRFNARACALEGPQKTTTPNTTTTTIIAIALPLLKMKTNMSRWLYSNKCERLQRERSEFQRSKIVKVSNCRIITSEDSIEEY